MKSTATEQEIEHKKASDSSARWLQAAAGVSLLAGGVLLLNGKRRAGTAVGASGAALALAGQQAELKRLWRQLPAAVDGAEEMLARVQRVLLEIETRRMQLHDLLGGKK